jgi:hypothetical protein
MGIRNGSRVVMVIIMLDWTPTMNTHCACKKRRQALVAGSIMSNAYKSISNRSFLFKIASRVLPVSDIYSPDRQGYVAQKCDLMYYSHSVSLCPLSTHAAIDQKAYCCFTYIAFLVTLNALTGHACSVFAAYPQL